MRKMETTFNLDIPVTKVWELFSDVNNYPRYVYFVKKIKASLPLTVGSRWEDTSTVFFLPLKFNHEMVSIKEKEEFSFKVFIPNGQMVQSYNFSGDSEKSTVLVQIDFGFNNRLIDKLIGPFWQMRLEKMLNKTISQLGKNLQ